MISVIDKNELRKRAKNLRHEFRQNGYLTQISSCILAKILNSSDFKTAKNIALYYPLDGEIDLRGLLSVPNKNYFLPRCVDDNLEFVQYENEKSLVENKWKILEPVGMPVNPKILDLIYIPALVANSRYFRLGYGKGYYDKFFASNHITAKKIIVISKKLVTDDFVEDRFDYRADEIICE